MTTTKISSDQLVFRSANTGETLLDTYLENAERGGKTLGELMADIFDTNGDFTAGATIDPAEMQFRFDPLNPSDLQFRFGTFASPAEDEVGWVTVGTVPTGGGTGDMLRANNLSDLINVVTAKANLLLGALADASTVSTALIDPAAVTLPKMANGTPNRALGYNAGGAPSELTAAGGTTISAGVISSAPIINDLLKTDGVDYTAGAGGPVGFAIPVNPGAAKNIFVTFDGVSQDDGLTFTFTPTTITFPAGIPALVSSVRIRIIT